MDVLTISAATSAAALTGVEQIPAMQGGAPRKVTAEQLRAYVGTKPVMFPTSTRAGLPAASSDHIGWWHVTDPESGKSLLIYCTGAGWVYVDGSAVTI